MSAVRRALLSVSDKAGLVDLGRGLVAAGIELLATGGTARALKAAGLPVVETESLTGFADLLDGRVKTLHPAIHAGILARLSRAEHLAQLKAAGIAPIGLVVVNLYPFESTVADPAVTLEDAIEQIDIGGVALLRSAAKNHADVGVLADPADYPAVLQELAAGHGELSEATRRRLALKAFEATAGYDAAIARFLGGRLRTDGSFPDRLPVSLRLKQALRYGENPHQTAALYTEGAAFPGSLAHAEQLNGKELSHNNYLDFDSALLLANEFARPACAVIKHRNACGCAEATPLGVAIERAVMADPLSAFGGIVAVNRPIDGDAARAILKTLEQVRKFDGLAAPGFSPEALTLLKEKKNLIILRTGEPGAPAAPRLSLRSITGGVLVQQADVRQVAQPEWKVVTKRSPTAEEAADLEFAWRVTKHLVSNAIVFGRHGVTVGIGAGQVNRVGSVVIAARQAGGKARGAAMASDAFFPYPDGVEEAGKAGITAAIQPGGSIKDPEVIAAADACGMAMVLTGVRHFKH